MLQVRSLIAGQSYTAAGVDALPVYNPATGEIIGHLDPVDEAGLALALQAAARGFPVWRDTSAYVRSRMLQDAARLLRERRQDIARLMTLEQGKPLAEALGEVDTAADNTEWMAQEATRAYGRQLTPRTADVVQTVVREPIGPVASFCPWNFPAMTPARKIAGALAAGCSLILKPSEETPFTADAVVRAFLDAGVPADVLSLVVGKSRFISSQLIASPIIRKISLTGSTEVGKDLLAQASRTVKRATMELGGHAPVIVFDDVDPVAAARQAVTAKFRNAGQVCTSPTRFFVQEGIYARFAEAFAEATRALKVGNGLEQGVQVGPLANARRVQAMVDLVDDAVGCGATLACGGKALPGPGHFFAPTVLTDVPSQARILHEEPFGPVAPLVSFSTFDEAIAQANALPFGLAAYVMTRSLARANAASRALEAGMVAINHFTVSTPASPFGGVKESGYGSEGGVEGLDAYLVTKSVTQRVAGTDLPL